MSSAIRVCAIAPGTIGTDLMLSARASIVDPLLATIVFPRRMGRPHEFAVLVENGGDRGAEATGGSVAAPIGRAVIAEALRDAQ